jgi:hypothetical protein
VDRTPVQSPERVRGSHPLLANSNAAIFQFTLNHYRFRVRGETEGQASLEAEEAESMTMDTATGGYSHTQKAPLCLILYSSALACIVLVWMAGETMGIYIAGGVGLLIALLAPCFHHLTVEDRGDVLAIRFGPVPLFRRTVLKIGRQQPGVS